MMYKRLLQVGQTLKIELINLFLGLTGLYVTWEIVYKLKLVDDFFFPESKLVSANFIDYPSKIEALHATASLLIESIGYSLVIGSIMATLIYIAGKVGSILLSEINLVKSIPPVSLLSLVLIFFGLGESSILILASYTGTLILSAGIASTLFSIPKNRIKKLQMLGASKWQQFYLVTIWEAMPNLFVTFKQAVFYNFFLVIFGEVVIGTKLGLGRNIYNAQIVYDIPEIYGNLLWIAILGFCLNLVIELTEKFVVDY